MVNDPSFSLLKDDSISWYRAIPSKFPPVDIWDKYANAREFENAAVIEGLSSQRLRLQQSGVGAITPEEQLFGPGSTPVMAAFAYPNRDGSRFSPGDFGIYYAGESIETVVAEVGYHRRRFWFDNPEQVQKQTFRIYVGQAIEPLMDLRSEQPNGPLHNPDSWSASQAFGSARRRDSDWGLRYRSVRRADGECIALLRPLASSRVVQSAHVTLWLDGDTVANDYRPG